MHKITYSMYNLFAKRLLEKVSTSDYFSGIITITSENIDYQLSISLVIYHSHEAIFTHEKPSIIRIVDVWCELCTTTSTGDKPNDFDFNTLKKLIIQC